jgi:Undecaprenyl-phosphate glucose phosphotransferase
VTGPGLEDGDPARVLPCARGALCFSGRWAVSRAADIDRRFKDLKSIRQEYAIALAAEIDSLPAGKVLLFSNVAARGLWGQKRHMVSFYDDLSTDKRITADAASRNPSTWGQSRLPPIAVSVVTGASDFLLVVGTAAATATAYSRETGRAVTVTWIVTAVLAATLFVGGFERMGGYTLKRLHQVRWQIRYELILWAATVSCLLLLAFADRRSGLYSRAWALSWIGIVPVALVAKSYLLQLVLETCGRMGSLAQNVVIIGTGIEAQRLIAKLRGSSQSTLVVRGVFDDDRHLPESVCGVPVLGTTDELLRLTRLRPIDEVIIALPLSAERKLKNLCRKLEPLSIEVRLSIEPLAELFQTRGTNSINGVPVLTIVEKPLKGYQASLKWAEDLIIASLLIILFLPSVTLIAILIKIDSRGPILFKQNRFGLNGEVINVLKFRTMQVDRGDAYGVKRTVRDDPRVTRVGRILRRLSLDELPQLINVLRGEMSLIGPRPHAVKMKVGGRLYGDAVERYPHRHRVKPGITGWAQVNGLRGEVDTLEKARARVVHDLYYIEHWSPWLDLKILMKTACIVLSREGAW